MSLMSSFAVFVEKPPKEGERPRYTVLSVKYHHDPDAIERMIADYLNEKRTTPLPAGLTHYMIFTTSSAQEAANQAQKSGLSYVSRDDVLRMRAEAENARKFGKGKIPDGAAKPPPANDRAYSQEEIDEIRGFCDALNNAFGGYKRGPF